MGWDSVSISIASGIAVALVVEVAVFIQARVRRRTSISLLRDVVRYFESKLASTKPLPPGPYGRGRSKEEVLFVYWQEHIDNMLVVVSAHAANISSRQYVEIMEAINDVRRVAKLVTDIGKLLPTSIYENYLSKMKKAIG